MIAFLNVVENMCLRELHKHYPMKSTSTSLEVATESYIPFKHARMDELEREGKQTKKNDIFNCSAMHFHFVNVRENCSLYSYALKIVRCILDIQSIIYLFFPA